MLPLVLYVRFIVEIPMVDGARAYPVKLERGPSDAIDMASPSPDWEHISVDLSDRLTVEEDNELRRLNYLWEMGLLSEGSRERLVELRLRDRRQKVRGPREFGEE